PLDHSAGLGAHRGEQPRKYVVVESGELLPSVASNGLEDAVPHFVRLVVAPARHPKAQGRDGVAQQLPGRDEALSPCHPPEDEGRSSGNESAVQVEEGSGVALAPLGGHAGIVDVARSPSTGATVLSDERTARPRR